MEDVASLDDHQPAVVVVALEDFAHAAELMVAACAAMRLR